MKKHPHLLEINAFVFLKRLSRKYSRGLTLLTVPDEEWLAVRKKGFDILWLMGVWKRSPGARRIAREHPDLRQVYDSMLPGWSPDDVPGSPYAVHAYELAPELGAKGDLAELREKLNGFGLRLFLDYVPNHTAFDHPLTLEKPEVFVEGSETRHPSQPELFFETKAGRSLAYGKDPYFAPWTDTAQINAFSKAARDFAARTLLSIAAQSDGVRCDMAMLLLNSVFEKTWGDHLKSPRPETEFWTDVISAVRKKHPSFIFMAEAYWDLEWELQQLGFDYTYDKKLYDKLLHGAPHGVRGHLTAEPAYQDRLVRFIENHDEERASRHFGKERSRAAAMVIATVPGLRFIHDGQPEGKQVRIPVQLAVEPEEDRDGETEIFYRKLLKFTDDKTLREGSWTLLEASEAWRDDGSFSNILAWAWSSAKQMRVIIINYSGGASRARVRFPAALTAAGEIWKLDDAFSGEVYERPLQEIRDAGLYVELAPWQAHWFKVKI